MSNKLPTVSELMQFAVTQPDQWEVTRQSLYDFQTYAAAGQTSLTFFQNPIGQSSKTKADTNMTTAGQLPNGKNFLVQSIEVLFFPGVDPSLEGTTIAETEFTNDIYSVAKSGYLDFFILSKSYLTEAPIGRFPPKTGLDVSSSSSLQYSEATASDAERFMSMDYARFSGRPYFIEPNITLSSNQNFEVTLNWPTAVTLPSGQNGRIGIVLDGLQYRYAQ
jgi:hypothetical protein